MKAAKTTKPKQKKSVSKTPWWRQKQIIFAGLLVVFFGLVIGGVLAHNRIGLAYDKFRYGREARATFNNEFLALQAPLFTLGIKPDVPSKCVVQPIFMYAKPQLQCSVSEDPYKVIGASQTSKAQFVATAGQLDTLLKQDGWTENQNATPTIKQWFEGITSGKDWYPDEGAYKNVDNSHCSIDFFLAFANPQPPAYRLEMNCSSPILQKFKNELF